jgi:hypothetical protein
MGNFRQPHAWTPLPQQIRNELLLLVIFFADEALGRVELVMGLLEGVVLGQVDHEGQLLEVFEV